MRHSIDDLIALVRRYYHPRTSAPEGQSEERSRLVAACRRAHAERKPFMDMLDRLQAKIPSSEAIYDGYNLIRGGIDASYSAFLKLPPRTDRYYARIQVSVIAPYYVLHTSRAYRVPGVTCPEKRPHEEGTLYEVHPDDIPRPHITVYCLHSPEEESITRPGYDSYAAIIAAEIESTYPGYQFMPPEIGKQVVPDVVADRYYNYAFSTLYDCLFASHL